MPVPVATLLLQKTDHKSVGEDCEVSTVIVFLDASNRLVYK